jgi:hypothetical protein
MLVGDVWADVTENPLLSYVVVVRGRVTALPLVCLDVLGIVVVVVVMITVVVALVVIFVHVVSGTERFPVAWEVLW